MMTWLTNDDSARPGGPRSCIRFVYAAGFETKPMPVLQPADDIRLVVIDHCIEPRILPWLRSANVIRSLRCLSVQFGKATLKSSTGVRQFIYELFRQLKADRSPLSIHLEYNQYSAPGADDWRALWRVASELHVADFSRSPSTWFPMSMVTQRQDEVSWPMLRRLSVEWINGHHAHGMYIALLAQAIGCIGNAGPMEWLNVRSRTAVQTEETSAALLSRARLFTSEETTHRAMFAEHVNGTVLAALVRPSVVTHEGATCTAASSPPQLTSPYHMVPISAPYSPVQATAGMVEGGGGEDIKGHVQTPSAEPAPNGLFASLLRAAMGEMPSQSAAAVEDEKTTSRSPTPTAHPAESNVFLAVMGDDADDPFPPSLEQRPEPDAQVDTVPAQKDTVDTKTSDPSMPESPNALGYMPVMTIESALTQSGVLSGMMNPFRVRVSRPLNGGVRLFDRNITDERWSFVPHRFRTPEPRTMQTGLSKARQPKSPQQQQQQQQPAAVTKTTHQTIAMANLGYVPLTSGPNDQSIFDKTVGEMLDSIHIPTIRGTYTGDRYALRGVTIKPELLLKPTPAGTYCVQQQQPSASSDSHLLEEAKRRLRLADSKRRRHLEEADGARLERIKATANGFAPRPPEDGEVVRREPVNETGLINITIENMRCTRPDAPSAFTAFFVKSVPLGNLRTKSVASTWMLYLNELHVNQIVAKFIPTLAPEIEPFACSFEATHSGVTIGPVDPKRIGVRGRVVTRWVPLDTAFCYDMLGCLPIHVLAKKTMMDALAHAIITFHRTTGRSHNDFHTKNAMFNSNTAKALLLDFALSTSQAEDNDIFGCTDCTTTSDARVNGRLFDVLFMTKHLLPLEGPQFQKDRATKDSTSYALLFLDACRVGFLCEGWTGLAASVTMYTSRMVSNGAAAFTKLVDQVAEARVRRSIAAYFDHKEMTYRAPPILCPENAEFHDPACLRRAERLSHRVISDTAVRTDTIVNELYVLGKSSSERKKTRDHLEKSKGLSEFTVAPLSSVLRMSMMKEPSSKPDVHNHKSGPVHQFSGEAEFQTHAEQEFICSKGWFLAEAEGKVHDLPSSIHTSLPTSVACPPSSYDIKSAREVAGRKYDLGREEWSVPHMKGEDISARHYIMTLVPKPSNYVIDNNRVADPHPVVRWVGYGKLDRTLLPLVKEFETQLSKPNEEEDAKEKKRIETVTSPSAVAAALAKRLDDDTEEEDEASAAPVRTSQRHLVRQFRAIERSFQSVNGRQRMFTDPAVEGARRTVYGAFVSDVRWLCAVQKKVGFEQLEKVECDGSGPSLKSYVVRTKPITHDTFVRFQQSLVNPSYPDDPVSSTTLAYKSHLALSLVSLIRTMHASGVTHGDLTLSSLRFDPKSHQFTIVRGDASLCIPTSRRVAEFATTAPRQVSAKNRYMLKSLGAEFFDYLSLYGDLMTYELATIAEVVLAAAPVQKDLSYPGLKAFMNEHYPDWTDQPCIVCQAVLDWTKLISEHCFAYEAMLLNNMPSVAQTRT